MLASSKQPPKRTLIMQPLFKAFLCKCILFKCNLCTGPLVFIYLVRNPEKKLHLLSSWLLRVHVKNLQEKK